jgi:ABC-type sugar transport system ATPase subunit
LSTLLFEARGMTKSYDGIPAVRGVDVSVEEGEVRAVIGENGAGKSTLMKMLTGAVEPDEGEIRIAGVVHTFRSPRQAMNAGIAIVHQELQLAPTLSVLDNLLLVRPPEARLLRRGSRLERSYVRSVTKRVGLDVDPDTPVLSLTTAQSQMLEIAKALSLNARIIVFDEPTAALVATESERLLSLIEALRADRHGILYVSHSLEEIMRIADNVSVLRDGQLVSDLSRSEANRDDLILAMVDRPGTHSRREPAPFRSDVTLSAVNLSSKRVRDVTLELHAGEILGFAGLAGCGMCEAALALCGAERVTGGTLAIAGRPVHFQTPRDALNSGCSLVPEERKREGIVPDLSVCENLHLGRLHRHTRYGVIDHHVLQRAADALMVRFQITPNTLNQRVANLSGGNQQKVLLARAVQTDPSVLVLLSPTRGVDVVAKNNIHSVILELASAGMAVVLSSPEIEEVLALAHRVAVFSGGRMVGILSREEATPVRIMQLAIATAN